MSHPLWKKLERWTRTDLTYLSQGSFWLLCTQGVTVVAGLITASIFAHLVTPNDYGIYRYLLATYGLISISTLPGIRTAMTRSISQGNDGMLFFGIRKQMQASLIGSSVSLSIALWYFLHENAVLGYGMLLIALLLPFVDTMDIGAYFQGKKNFRALAVYSIGTIGITTVSVSTGILLGGGPVLLFGCFLASTALLRMGTLLIVRKKIPFLKTPGNTSTQKELMRFGIHLSGLNIFSLAASSLDKIALFHFLDSTAVAQYAFATAMPNQLRGVVRHLGTLALPKFSTRPPHEVYEGLVKRLPILLLILSGFVGAYVLCAPSIFAHLFPQYSLMVPLSQWFCLSIIDASMYPISTALTAQKETKILTYFSVTNSSIDILLVCICAPLFGLSGVIIGKIISRLCNVLFGVSILFYLEHHPHPRPSVR